MRTIDAHLTTAQAHANATHTAGLELEGVDRSSYLVAFTHRTAAMQAKTSTVWLDNTSGFFTTNPPARGDTIDLTRGCIASGTAYTAELPRLWVEKVTYRPGYVILSCLDFWGKLSRYHNTNDVANWTTTDPSAIIDWILSITGLLRSGSLDQLYIDYQMPRGQRGDLTLKNVAATVSQVPYHGLDRYVKFKALPSDEASVYTFGWNTHHPVLAAAFTQTAALYNRVTVYGQLKSDSDRYSGVATDTSQSTLVGIREKFIVDNSLSSDTECDGRATAELSYYSELTDTAELTVQPCHGLEIFDVITLASPPWGGANVTARVSSITEYFHPDSVKQEIAVSAADVVTGLATTQFDAATVPQLDAAAPLSAPYGSPAGDPYAGDVSPLYLQSANLSASLITDATSDLVDPASLSALHIVGAAVYDTSSHTHINSASEAAAAFLTSAGRAAQIGDILIDQDTTDSVYRLYVKVASGTWITYTTTTTLT